MCQVFFTGHAFNRLWKFSPLSRRLISRRLSAFYLFQLLQSMIEEGELSGGVGIDKSSEVDSPAFTIGGIER